MTTESDVATAVGLGTKKKISIYIFVLVNSMSKKETREKILELTALLLDE